MLNNIKQVSIVADNKFVVNYFLDKLLTYYFVFKGAEHVAALTSFQAHGTTVTSSLVT